MDIKLYSINQMSTGKCLLFDNLTVGVIRAASYLGDMGYNDMAVEVSNKLYYEIMRERHKYPSAIYKDIKPVIVFVEIEKVKPVIVPETIYPVTPEEAKPKNNNVKLLL